MKKEFLKNEFAEEIVDNFVCIVRDWFPEYKDFSKFEQLANEFLYESIRQAFKLEADDILNNVKVFPKKSRDEYYENLKIIVKKYLI